MEFIIKYNQHLSSFSHPVEILNERYAILDLEPKEAEQILLHPEIEYIELADRVFPSALNTSTANMNSPAFSRASCKGLAGTGVIVGVIDSGIDATHPAFQTPQRQTRILSLWDMTEQGEPPLGFWKGHVYHAADINAGEVSSRDELGHGTAVAGIAAGNEGVAPGASLVVVKIGSGSARTTDIMRGVKYIVDQAREAGMPCVINISYGTNLGSHRGQSLFEEYLNDMTQQWKNSIVSAAGNEGSSGHHFCGQLETGAVVRADFAVASQYTSLYLILWNNFTDTITYELVLPNGYSTGNFNFEGGSIQYSLPGGHPVHLWQKPNPL